MPARSDFARHLGKETILPIYALVGSESVLVSEAVDALRAHVLTQAPDFNRDEMRAGEVPVARVIDAARTLPMMAPRRWVHLYALQRLKAKEHPILMSYLEAPSESTVLCLSGEKLDLRTKLGQKLMSLGAVFALDPPRLRELPAWIEQRATKKGYAIEPDAAQLLADLVGTDIGGLDMALEKLATYAGGDERITCEHVEAVVAPTRVRSIFDLTDAIGGRDLPRATLTLRSALGGGESALMVLAMIARQLRHLLQVKELGASGARPAEIAKRVGIRPFLVDPLTVQSRRYATAELCAALDAVARADVRLKSSRLDPGVVLDRLLLEVIRPEPEAS